MPLPTGPYLDNHRTAVHTTADGDLSHPCKYSHFGCSAIPGGLCLDEILTAHEKVDPDCPLCEERERREAEGEDACHLCNGEGSWLATPAGASWAYHPEKQHDDCPACAGTGRHR